MCYAKQIPKNMRWCWYDASIHLGMDAVYALLSLFSLSFRCFWTSLQIEIRRNNHENMTNRIKCVTYDLKSNTFYDLVMRHMVYLQRMRYFVYRNSSASQLYYFISFIVFQWSCDKIFLYSIKLQFIRHFHFKKIRCNQFLYFRSYLRKVFFSIICTNSFFKLRFYLNTISKFNFC